MVVTFYSPNPKVSPVQISISDEDDWQRLVCLYLAPKGTYSYTWVNYVKSKVDDGISGFNFIEISHEKLFYLLSHYFGYDKYMERINGRLCATDMYLEFNRIRMVWEMDWDDFYKQILILKCTPSEEIEKQRVEYFQGCTRDLVRKGYCEEGDDPFGLLPFKKMLKVNWELKGDLE